MWASAGAWRSRGGAGTARVASGKLVTRKTSSPPSARAAPQWRAAVADSESNFVIVHSKRPWPLTKLSCREPRGERADVGENTPETRGRETRGKARDCLAIQKLNILRAQIPAAQLASSRLQLPRF